MRYTVLSALVLTLVLNSCSSKNISTNTPKTAKTIKSKHTNVVPLMMPTGAVFTLDEKAQDRFSDSCPALSFREGVLYYNLKKDPLNTIEAITQIDRNYKRKCMKR